jgi:hypothetical protein
MSKEKKGFPLPLETGPGEGLEDAWWEDDLLAEPPAEQEVEETNAGFSSVWEVAPLTEEGERWEPDDESLEGFDDVDSWTPLLDEEESPLPAEVPAAAPVVDIAEDEDEDAEDDATVPSPPPELPVEDDETDDDAWAPRVISWAPNVLITGRQVASICSTDHAATVLRIAPGEWPELEGLGVVELELTVEDRTISLPVRIEQDTITCVVLGRDALVQARLLVDPAQN